MAIFESKVVELALEGKVQHLPQVLVFLYQNFVLCGHLCHLGLQKSKLLLQRSLFCILSTFACVVVGDRGVGGLCWRATCFFDTKHASPLVGRW